MGMAQRPIIGVGVVILRRDSQAQPMVLLIRRGQEPGTGQWSLPGGKQEPGETVRAAAVREAKEETGLDVELLGLVDVVDLITPERHLTLIDFAARPTGGMVKAGSDADAAVWVRLDALAPYRLWTETERVIRESVSFLP